MPDLFLAFAHLDQDFASGLADNLAGRGLEIGRDVSLWPGQRLLSLIDRELQQARHAIVVVSREFLKFSWQEKVLDGLATRGRVFPLLHGVDESDVRPHSRRLAVAAIPGGMAENLVRLLRPSGGPNGRAS